LTEGAAAGAKIGVACACVGIMAQVMSSTGLGVKMASVVEALSFGYLWLALMITMLISLVLGCGVPTVAAYLLVAIIVAPVLITMGVGLLQAHFFCFYFAIVSALTPPVAMAALAGASIAGAKFFETCKEAFKLGFAGFILPYLIVFNPMLILKPKGPVYAALSLISVLAGLTATQAVIYNHFIISLSRPERLLFLSIAAAFFGYSFTKLPLCFLTGIILLIFVVLRQWNKKTVPKNAGTTKPSAAR